MLFDGYIAVLCAISTVGPVTLN